MKKGKRILRALAAVCLVVFMAMMTARLVSAPAKTAQTPAPRKDTVGVITLWHVVGFKPYRGSVSTLISDAAKKIERANYGVYFDVIAMTVEDYGKRIARGEQPDMISFPAGLLDGEELLALEPDSYPVEERLLATGTRDNILYALPFALSPVIVAANNDLARKAGLELPEGMITPETFAAAVSKAEPTGKAAVLAGDPLLLALLGGRGETVGLDAFKEGKAACAAGPMRLGAELSALSEKGKGFAFTIHGVTGSFCMAQYIALGRDINKAKTPYALLLASALMGNKTQAKLAALGLAPVIEMEADWSPDPALPVDPVAACKSAFLPNAFLLNRYEDALGELAARVLAGEEGAARELEQRRKELVKGMQIK